VDSDADATRRHVRQLDDAVDELVDWRLGPSMVDREGAERISGEGDRAELDASLSVARGERYCVGACARGRNGGADLAAVCGEANDSASELIEDSRCRWARAVLVYGQHR
jgi:hypothetical protein